MNLDLSLSDCSFRCNDRLLESFFAIVNDAIEMMIKRKRGLKKKNKNGWGAYLLVLGLERFPTCSPLYASSG